MSAASAPIDRRTLLRAASAGALIVAVPLKVRADDDDDDEDGELPPTDREAAGANQASGMLTAYVVVQPDSRVLVLSPVTEMGQGTLTAHALLVADELGVDMAQVDVRTAIPADPYRGGGFMMTSGSNGLRGWYMPLRIGAARAREMLITAAAARLDAPPRSVTIENGRAKGPGGKGIPIGDLVADAVRLTPPMEPPLKPAVPTGTREVRRLDLPDKVTGRTVYAHDLRLPGMIYACARFSPVFHGDIKEPDTSAATAIPGVRGVVRIRGGVAVLAGDSWTAMRGAEAVRFDLAPTGHDGLGSAGIRAAMLDGLSAPTAVAAAGKGDVDAGLAAAPTAVEADYEVPYLSHAPMEPFAATLILGDGRLEIWAPTQLQDRILMAVERAAALPRDRIILHTPMLGGAFGRRLTEEWVEPALAVARANPGIPVRFFWSRETEFALGWYRPAQMARLKAGLDAGGRVSALSIRISGPSLRMEFLPAFIKEGDLDRTSVQDLTALRYALGAYRLDYAMRHVPVTAAPWRSVGASQNAFFLECFIDELAHAAGADPMAFRRRLLADDSRALAVLDLVAEKSGWGTPLPAGRARGVAFFETVGSVTAQVAEVSVDRGRVVVHRIVAVVDCGTTILPDAVRAQIEGGIVQGVSAALHEQATIRDGRAQQTNFDTYRLLRLPETPRIDVHLVPSDAPPAGVGEAGVPAVAPALANAVSSLLNRRIRKLPISIGSS